MCINDFWISTNLEFTNLSCTCFLSCQLYHNKLIFILTDIISSYYFQTGVSNVTFTRIPQSHSSETQFVIVQFICHCIVFSWIINHWDKTIVDPDLMCSSKSLNCEAELLLTSPMFARCWMWQTVSFTHVILMAFIRRM